jgi:O-antigen/teichoic acid export membrane protein
MQRKFITNLALLLLLNLLIKPFWILGIDRSVQNAVSPQSFGIYSAIFSFSLLLNILLDFGITNFNNKNIAQNNNLLNKHLSSIVLLRVALGAVYFIITITAGFIIGYTSDELLMLMVLGFNQFLLSFILYLRSNIAGLHLFKTDSIISVLDRTLMIGICAYLLWGRGSTGQPFEIWWYVYAQTAAYLATICITFIIVIKKAKLKRLYWNKTFLLVVLKKSYPYAVLVLLMTFYNRIDTVMLERMLPDGKEQTSIYVSAYRLLDSANMIAFLFAGLLLPMFSRMIKLKHNVDKLVKLSYSILAFGSIIVAVGSFFYSDYIMELLNTNHIEESSKVFGVLMSCFIAISITYVFGTLLTANGNLMQLNIMASIGMALNIVLNIFLIPLYKAYGSALSSLITQFITAFFQVYLCQKVFKFRVNYRFLITLFVFLIGVIVFNYVSLKMPINDWIMKFVIMTIMSTLFAFTIRLINLKALYNVIKNDT